MGERIRRELQCPLRDELLDGEIFYTLREAQIVIESWAATTTPSGPMQPSATRLLPPRCSCQRSPHGRLRNPTSSAGHATRGAPTKPKLTLTPDHSSGADQGRAAEGQDSEHRPGALKRGPLLDSTRGYSSSARSRHTRLGPYCGEERLPRATASPRVNYKLMFMLSSRLFAVEV